jgi:phosphate transport system protein
MHTQTLETKECAVREQLDRSLAEIAATVTEMGSRADAMLTRSLQALATNDANEALQVIRSDRGVDHRYASVQHQILTTVALQSPVGLDLRLLTAHLHASLHIERMADHAVSIARAVQRSDEAPTDPAMHTQIVGMGEQAKAVCRTAVEALVAVDEAKALTVLALDNEVDALLVQLFRELLHHAEGLDGERLKHVFELLGVIRRIERYADHGVDIAEQVVFAATGELIEFSSHPNA